MSTGLEIKLPTKLLCRIQVMINPIQTQFIPEHRTFVNKTKLHNVKIKIMKSITNAKMKNRLIFPKVNLPHYALYPTHF